MPATSAGMTWKGTVLMPHDLILRGGRVVDPSQKLDRVTDVAFANGKVAAVGDNLKADASTEVRNVAGYIVTPGLIDLHTHVYWGGTSLGIDAEQFARDSGVTTSIDTGSAGPGNFAGFRKHVIEPCQVRILAYLHVSFAGIYGFSSRVHLGESEDIRLMAPIDCVEVANANRDLVVGIDSRTEDDGSYRVYQYTGDEKKTVQAKRDTAEWARSGWPETRRSGATSPSKSSSLPPETGRPSGASARSLQRLAGMRAMSR